jgi:hypothetical protein
VPITTAFAAALLGEEFLGTAVSWPATFWLSLHTADPGAGGNQSTSEFNYFGYNRVSIGRTGSEWALAAGPSGIWKAVLQTTVDWPFTTTAFGLPAVVNCVGVGFASSGAGFLARRLIPTGTPPTILVGQTPRLVAGAEFFICQC